MWLYCKVDSNNDNKILRDKEMSIIVDGFTDYISNSLVIFVVFRYAVAFLILLFFSFSYSYSYYLCYHRYLCFFSYATNSNVVVAVIVIIITVFNIIYMCVCVL